MFKRILVPLDGSARAESAIAVAARVARAYGASIILLRIAETPVEYGPYLAPPASYAKEAVRADLERMRVVRIAALDQHRDPTGARVGGRRFPHVDLVVIARSPSKGHPVGLFALQIAVHDGSLRFDDRRRLLLQDAGNPRRIDPLNALAERAVGAEHALRAPPDRRC